MPGTVLIERAQSEHSIVIVMATPEGVVRMLLGSVADKIVHAGVTPALLALVVNRCGLAGLNAT